MERDTSSSTILGIHRDAWPVVFGSMVGSIILLITGIGSLAAGLLAFIELVRGTHRDYALLSSLVLLALGFGTLYAVYVVGNTPKWYRASTRALLADDHVSVSLEFHEGPARDGTDAWVRVCERVGGPVLFERLDVLLTGAPTDARWKEGLTAPARMHTVAGETVPRVFSAPHGLLWVQS